jgi:hypothetical protein
MPYDQMVLARSYRVHEAIHVAGTVILTPRAAFRVAMFFLPLCR